MILTRNSIRNLYQNPDTDLVDDKKWRTESYSVLLASPVPLLPRSYLLSEADNESPENCFDARCSKTLEIESL